MLTDTSPFSPHVSLEKYPLVSIYSFKFVVVVCGYNIYFGFGGDRNTGVLVSFSNEICLEIKKINECNFLFYC